MNYKRIYNATKRQFNIVMRKEGMTVPDYYNKEKTYKVFFRHSKNEDSAEDRLRLFYAQETEIANGTMFNYHDNTYVVVSQDAIESDIYFSSRAELCDSSILVQDGDSFREIPVSLSTDVYTTQGEDALETIAGYVIIYTGLNEFTRKIKINDKFSCYGGNYLVTNFLYRNGIVFLYLEREVDATLNYALIYTGKTSVDLKDGSYRLTYNATLNGESQDHPTLTYEATPAETATVDASGVLTLLQEGVVTVTATWTDGNNTQCVTQITINGDEPVEPPAPENKGRAEITCTRASVTIGFDRKFTANFYDLRESPVQGVTPVWSITDCNFREYLETQEGGNILTVTAKSEMPMEFVDETFNLNLADDKGGYTPHSIAVTIVADY